MRVGNLLKTTHLILSEIASLTNTNYKPVTGTINDRSCKRIGEINYNADDEWKDTVFPAFDLHMCRISFGNGDKRISIIVFEVRCYLDKSSILKIILSHISSDDKIPSSEETVHFVQYGFI